MASIVFGAARGRYATHELLVDGTQEPPSATHELSSAAFTTSPVARFVQELDTALVHTLKFVVHVASSINANGTGVFASLTHI